MRLHPASARLRRYCLDEADAAERLLVEDHLGGCARCRALVAQQAQLDEWLVECCPVPDQPQATRQSLQRLWEQVDRSAAPPVPGARGRAAPRPVARLARRAAWALPLLAAGIVVVLLRDGLAPPETAPAAEDRGASPVAVQSGLAATDGAHAPAPGPTPAPAPPSDDPAERLDPARLAAARAALSSTLLAAHEACTEDREAFAEACADDVHALRAAGWPVHHLLRGLAAGTDPTLVTAALRWAAVDATCSATLADALARPERAALALRLLQESAAAGDMARAGADDPDSAGDGSADAAGRLTSLVGPLATLSGSEEAALPPELRVQAVKLLARACSAGSGSGAASAALTRVLQRAFDRVSSTAEPEGAEARAWLDAVAAAAPDELLLTVLLERGAQPASRAVAQDCFRARAQSRGAAWTGSVGRALAAAPDAQLSLLARWAAQCELRDLGPQLLAALRAHPDQPDVADAAARLGGGAAACELWVLLQQSRGRTSEAPLRAALVAGLTVDAEAGLVLASSWSAAESADAVALVELLPAERRGPLLVAALRQRRDDTADQAARERLLTGLARLGTAADGEELLAWIEARPRTDRVLALAWTTAYCLCGTEARGAWERDGRDPALLASAADARGAWPLAAPAPPARVLRTLDKSLRRTPPRAAASAPPTSKETL